MCLKFLSHANGTKHDRQQQVLIVSVFYLTCFITCVSLQKIFFFFLEATFDDASTQTELWKAGLWPSKFEFFLLGPSL